MEEIEARVQRVFAGLTRYPVEILELDADFDQDLGIDSVKRGEIFAVLAQQFALPPMEELPSDHVWTIRSIANAIQEYARRSGSTTTVSPTSAVPAPRLTPAPAQAPAAPSVSYVAPALAPHSVGLNGSHGNSNGAGADGNSQSHTASLVGAADEHVLRTLLNVIQKALDGSVTPPVTPLIDSKRSPVSTRFLAPGHRPFEGKVAFVTGSGRGLGKVIVNQLADLGARVIVNSFFSRDRGERVTAEINARGGDAIHLWGSVANPKQLAQMFEEIDERYDGLDFFVQNASNGVIAPIDQITDAHWEKAFRTNVVALHQGALLAAPLMRRRGGGRIVAISSPGAHHHIEHFGCIGPVKAAVEALIVYLAVELGPSNIQVNALSAGPLYGELMDSYPDSERLVKHWEARAPDHRLGEEAEVSNTVMYLLSDLANKTSGAVLLVDGASSRRL